MDEQQQQQQQEQEEQKTTTHLDDNISVCEIAATSSSNNINININNSSNKVSVSTQTEPNLIDKLIDSQNVKKQLDDIDLYQEYVRSAQCAQFWPLDKNPIRSLVPAMIKVDLPEQYLKNESLMFDLVQAITNNSKLVNLLAKYIHHIVPNVIISKRIDLIPLITCTIRVCRDTGEQERLISLLFNLIKRPNEEQRRMILSGIVVVLQVSPDQSSSLLLPNLWDHVNDKFPERRILLAESCSTLAHYVRPIMRTNLVLSILMQLLKDKNAAVRSAACKSFACLLTLIMDRNDEVFDACLTATDDIIQDVLQQSPVNFCEYRYELEQMRHCALETVYPLLCMWAVKLNRFKIDVAEFYLAKAEKYSQTILNQDFDLISSNLSTSSIITNNNNINGNGNNNNHDSRTTNSFINNQFNKFTPSLSSSSSNSNSSSSSSQAAGGAAATAASYLLASRRHSSYVGGNNNFALPNQQLPADLAQTNSAMLTYQRALGAYMKMLNYLIPFVFSDSVNGCAWLSKSNLLLADKLNSQQQSSTSTSTSSSDLNNNNNNSTFKKAQKVSLETSGLEQQSLFRNGNGNGNGNGAATSGSDSNNNQQQQQYSSATSAGSNSAASIPGVLFDRPITYANKLLDPILIIDESAIVAFHDQLEQEHMIESLDWILNLFLPKFLTIISHFSSKKLLTTFSSSSCSFSSTLCSNNNGNSSSSSNNLQHQYSSNPDLIKDFLASSISSTRQLCLLFGKHLTRNKIRPLIKLHIQKENNPTLYCIYIASLTSFEPIEQQEFEEIVTSIRNNLNNCQLSKCHVEILALTIKLIATSEEHIQSPSTRQKFLTYVLDALVNCSNKFLRLTATSMKTTTCNNNNNNSQTLINHNIANNDFINSQLISEEQNNNNNNNAIEKGGVFLETAGQRLKKKFQLKKSHSLSGSRLDLQKQQTQMKEFILLIFRHILTCLIDPLVRPTDWAHILVTKFLPLLISLANDSTDVYVCTYARLMCAQLVETFDTYLNSPKMNKQLAESILPALKSLRILTEQIRASNLKRQIECLSQDLNHKFFNDIKSNCKDDDNNNNNNNNNNNSGVAIILEE